ncbi:MAG TPA: UbiA family prenyltransferase [Patescibacteria group bacterium]|nr:UbiA family prenyltransferase [Patescibacteria group bacterium]
MKELHQTNNSADPVKPLFVDLDGTLITSDILWESFLAFLKKHPVQAYKIPLWLSKGKAVLKRELAERVTLDVTTLPYNTDIIEFLKNEKERGREVILATATDEKFALKIAEHTQLFSKVLSSNGTINLSGSRKLTAIQSMTNGIGFDYIGNATVDLPLWAAANRAMVVTSSQNLVRKAEKFTAEQHVFRQKNSVLKNLTQALRVHQWVKNLLLFVPLFMAHIFSPDLFVDAVLAFFSFSFCASSVYLLNDLLDIESDRVHPRKRKRPFAAGTLSIPLGIAAAPLLLIASFSIAWLFLPLNFLLLLGFYYALTTCYSFFLKRIVILDVLVLAGLYTLRIFSGAMAVDVPVSPWLLAFSTFTFLSLAFVKRYAELKILIEQNKTGNKARGYNVDDLHFVGSVGPSSGYMAALVLALYINSADVVKLYDRPMVLWLAGLCFLYWITRVWILAHRGQMVDDPIIFTFRDKISYMVGAFVFVILLIAM